MGKPYLPDVKVSGEIVEQGRGEKITIFKFKRRKKYRRKMGHRQELHRGEDHWHSRLRLNDGTQKRWRFHS